MKLIRLRIRNIATYDEQEIDFEKLSYPVFVTGNTGTGKTTLFIDAITAALFGCAYGQKSKGIQKILIMRGRREGVVELEFEIADKRYLVRRVFREGGVSDAQLFLINGNRRQLIAISSSKVDEKIKEITGLTFDIIMNSAMVRQGDVYRFLDVKPAERRNLLVEILKIKLDELKQKAEEERKKLENKIELLKRDISNLEEDIKKKPEYIEKLTGLESELPKIEARKKELDAQINKTEIELENVRREISGVQAQLEKINYVREQLSKEKKEYEELYREIKELESTIKTYGEEKIRNAQTFKDILREYEIWVLERERLEKELESLKEALKAKKELKELELMRQELALVKDEYDKVGELLEEIRVEKKNRSNKISEIEKYLNELEKAEVNCPVCGSPLPSDKKEERKRHLEMEKINLMDEKKELESKERELMLKIGELKKKVDELWRVEGKVSVLAKMVSKHEPIEQRIEEKERALEELTTSISKHFQAITQYAGTSNIAEAKKIINRLSEINQQLPRLDEMRKNLIELNERIREKEKELENMAMYEKKLEELKRKESELSKTLDTLRKNKEMVIGRLRGLEERIRNIKERLKEIEEKEKRLKLISDELNKLQLDERAYNILEKEVFAPGALPAKLLDEYLRILEEYANEYLRIFGQDIEIVFVYKRAKGEQQSVDLKSYANGYERRIETFSGGERTLIGFAIRLAIGKLLTEIYSKEQRPRFLIIDEGFGPLDENLRLEVARALNNLKEEGEYEQIIVISHQQELKNEPIFRTIIQVTKDRRNLSRVKEISMSS